MVFVTLAATSLAFVAWSGCGSSTPANTGPDTGNCTRRPECDFANHPADLENPVTNCSPTESCASTYDPAKVSTCPADNECMARVKQSGDVVNLRMGRIRLVAPSPLLAVTPLAVDPNVNPVCVYGGSEGFNWLLQINRATSTVKTGGARKSPDGKTFTFSVETVDSSKLSELCPGFVGPKDPISLAPVTVKLAFTGNTFTSEKIDKINIPIFEGTVPIILPLRDTIVKNATLSSDNTCIGKWQKEYWLDSETLGWTTGGAIVGKITVADADKVPVQSAGCQSLCAILANDKNLIDPATKKTCKKNTDGSYPEIGDSCVDAVGCKNAFRLAASFAAYGVNIPGPIGGDGGDAGDGG